MKFLATLNILFALTANAGTIENGVVKGSGQFNTNYVVNPSGEKNNYYWSASNSTVTRDTDAADKLNGVSSLSLSSATDGGALNSTVPGGTVFTLTNETIGDCEAYTLYKTASGDGSKWTLAVKVSGTVVASVALTNESVWRQAVVNYPCGANIQVSFVHTGTGTDVINFGNVYFGKATNLTSATPVTAWESWTPTGSWSTNTTYYGKKRRVGDTLEMQVTVATSGAPTAAGLTVNIPSGLTINTSNLAGTVDGNSHVLGNGGILDNGTGGYNIVVGYNNTTSLKPVLSGTAGTYATPATISQIAPITFAAGDQIFFEAKLPITEWASSQTAVTMGSEPLVQSSKQEALTAWTITADQWGDLASVTLTAGTWDISGVVSYYNNGAVSAGNMPIGIGTTSGNNAPNLGDPLSYQRNFGTSGDTYNNQTPVLQVSPATTTVYYLKGNKNNAITNMQANWKLHARLVSRNAPAPILVGGVTSSYDGLLKTNVAYVTNPAGTPLINFQYGNWISVTDNGLGDYVFTMTGFSQPPICNVTMVSSTAFARIDAGWTATTIEIKTFTVGTTPTLTDAYYVLQCTGPR